MRNKLLTIPQRPGLLFAFVFCVAAVFPNGSVFAQDEDAAERRVIVCSSTQVADFARQIVGDRWEVICVLGPAEDPHSYTPTPQDTADVARADLCLENGWHLEGNEWMKTLAEENGKPIVSCIEGVEPIDLEAEDGADEGETINDPHAWFDPPNAWIYTKNIRDAVIELDPENASEYTARADLYKVQLRELDGWVNRTLNEVETRVLITHHDAFGYFCRAYNFQSESPVGWSTADFANLTPDQRKKIIDSIRDHGVKSLFIETTAASKTLDEIAKDAGVQIGGTLYSDAMGTAGSAGETYIGMMRENVLTIVNGLRSESGE